MGQPVKLSDDLIADARAIAEASERSIASQIEFWARLGRALEPALRTDALLTLKQRGEVTPLSACLAGVDTPAGREKVERYLADQPFPHFEPAQSPGGRVVKIDADGTRTAGRFVKREFQPARRR